MRNNKMNWCTIFCSRLTIWLLLQVSWSSKTKLRMSLVWRTTSTGHLTFDRNSHHPFLPAPLPIVAAVVAIAAAAQGHRHPVIFPDKNLLLVDFDLWWGPRQRRCWPHQTFSMAINHSSFLIILFSTYPFSACGSYLFLSHAHLVKDQPKFWARRGKNDYLTFFLFGRFYFCHLPIYGSFFLYNFPSLCSV